MTGKEFTELLEGIEKITEIRWEIEGEPLDPEEVYFVFVGDGEEHSVPFPDYEASEDDNFMKKACMGLVINKFMRQIGNDFRYNLHMDEVDAVNYSRRHLK